MSSDATAAQLSDYAAAFSHEHLDAAAVHAVKRALVDAIGCALGAHA
jgi:2-methylcitrate dehydratase PrpD